MTYLNITTENRSELDNLEQYKNLSSLYIKCDLNEIPVFKNLKELRLLSLSNNKIRSLDGLKNLKNLKNLEELFLYSNLIEDISSLEYLKVLPNLRVLNLSGNKIRSLDGLINFENLKNLKELRLSSNLITNINGIEYLKVLPNLKKLYISSNKIASLKDLKDLRNLKNLEKLYLFSNLLEDLEGFEHLNTLSNLKFLDLSDNNISMLDLPCPIPPSLTKLIIYDNPISNVNSLAGFKDHKQSCSIEFFRRDRFTDDNYKQFIRVVKDAELIIKKRTDFYEDEGEYDVEVIDLWKPPPPSKEFKVNKYITLKLNYNDKTVIYVNDVKFRQCRYLMIEISLDDFKSKPFNNINSIDDLEEDPDYSLEFSEDESPIPPEAEFWGHSSNLQAWCELDYDTRILHRNLAFPLLKKLTEAGDKKAQKVFKEEIARRYTSGNKSVKEFLRVEGYLDFLSKDELSIL